MRTRIFGRIAGLLLPALFATAVSAQTVVTTTAASNYAINGAANIVVDNGLSLTSPTALTQVTATIASGFQSGDVLSYSGTLPANVSGNYNSASGVLTFTGPATAADYQALLRTVKISLSSASGATRAVTFTVGTLLAYTNGHFYEYKTAPTSWTDAKTNAAGLTYYGLTGYLATITSDGENTFIQQKLSSDGWIGSSDEYTQINAATGTTTFANQAAAEGHWYWVTGPEKGTNFSNGNNSPVTVTNQYAKWNSGEPNAYGGGEDYGEIYSSGTVPGAWNDLPNSSSLGYVVEYGGLPGDPAVQLSSSRNVVIQSTSITGTYNSGSYQPNTAAKVVDNSLTLYATGNITNALVTISSGKQTGDVLSYTGTLPAGITPSYNSTTGVLTFTGTTTPANFQALLRTVTFAAVTGANISRAVTFSLGSDVAGTNGHFYRYVAASAITWANAKTGAAALTYYGLTGYLATITTADENAFITQKLNSDGWIGGSDAFGEVNAATGATTFADQNAAEGHWYWVTGPEKGSNFSNGNTSPVTVVGKYANWNTNEPNNSNGENFAQIYASGNNLGKWNDLNGNTQNGYVVEFGGLSSDPAITLTSSSLITVTTPLPVEGIALQAKLKGSNVAVSWLAYNEKDVRSYRIERSSNGRDFGVIGETASVGNGDNRYETFDRQPLSGLSYYRIQSVDVDGSTAYSAMVAVRMDVTNPGVQLYPNPATATLTVVIPVAGVAATITDGSGRQVLSQVLTGTTNSIDIRHLPAGNYFLHTGDEKQGLRFIKQ